MSAQTVVMIYIECYAIVTQRVRVSERENAIQSNIDTYFE